MVDLNKFRAKFVEESKVNLQALQRTAAAIDAAAPTAVGLEEGFRAAHSIKGSAGMFGFERLAALATEAEAVLHALMEGTATTNPVIARAIGDAHATIDLMVDCIELGTETATGIEDSLVARLSGLHSATHAAA